MEHINTEKITADVLDLVNIVMRQTDYDKQTSLAKLQENNYDPLKVIRAYICDGAVIKVKTQEKPTTNQLVYKEMRKMLDDVEKTRREMAEQN